MQHNNIMACITCTPYFVVMVEANNSLQKQVSELQTKCVELSRKNEFISLQAAELKEHCCELERKVKQMEEHSIPWEDVHSEYIQPGLLTLDCMGQYLLELVANFPIIGIIVNLFLSNSHKRKYNANTTHPKWKIWSEFYKCWLADLFLHSRSPKTVRRMTLLFSAYMLLCNVSKPAWRLMQRLHLVTSKEVLEKWLRCYKKLLLYSDSLLMYVIDNCEVKVHVTYVRPDHKNSIIHLISRFVVEIPQRITVQPSELWRDVDREQFGTWLMSNNDEMIAYANKNWVLFSNRPKGKPLRFAHQRSPNNVKKSDITFLQPLFNLKTLSNEDVEEAIQVFHRAYMEYTRRVCAVVSGDFQVWIKLWIMIMKNRAKYNWMIPVPGEWH